MKAVLFGKHSCFRMQIMMVELGKMLGFLEVAEFGDFRINLSFSLCRVESLQLSFWVLVNKYNYLTEDIGPHSALRFPASCIGTIYFWLTNLSELPANTCLNPHFSTIKHSRALQFLIFLQHEILETRDRQADKGKKTGKLSGHRFHLFLYPLV